MSGTALADGMSYEEAFEQLEALVNSLEDGRMTLAEAVGQYERGTTLAFYCSKLLDEAELRVRQLQVPDLGELGQPADDDGG